MKSILQQSTLRDSNKSLKREVLELQERVQLLEQDNKRLEKIISNTLDILQAFRQFSLAGEDGPSIQEILEQAPRIFELMDAGLITLFDEQSGRDEVVAAYNHDWQVVSNVHLGPHEGATGWVFTTKAPKIWSGVDAVEGIFNTLDSANREKLENSKADTGRKSLMCSPLIVQDKVVGAIQVEHIVDHRQFDELELQILTHLVANPLAAALESAGIVSAISRDNVKMRDLLRRTIRAREKEREQISHDLHDSIAQTLAGLHIAVMNLQVIASKQGDNEQVMKYLEDLDNDVKKTIDATQDLVFDLRPSVLNDYGLIGALSWYLEERFAVSGIATQIQISSVDQKLLDDAVAITLYRVAQEALNNVLRHAEAQHVFVKISASSDELELMIKDDGRGFSREESERVSGNLGLRGMEERLAMVGGVLVVESAINHGTNVVARVPMTGGTQ